MDTGRKKRPVIDIHSHVLPRMDDGSESSAESLAILRASAAQGIGYMAATPHFYARENNPERFLHRRAASAARLRENWQSDLPRLLLGAEVCYFEGIARVEEMDALRIEGTPLLLLEMPFAPWTDRMLSEVYELNRRPGMTVLLAHIERYLRWQRDEIWDELTDSGILMQCNAEFFLRWRTRRRALTMLRGGTSPVFGFRLPQHDRPSPKTGRGSEGHRPDRTAGAGAEYTEIFPHAGGMSA